MVKNYDVNIYAKNLHSFKLNQNYRPSFWNISDVHWDNPKCNQEAFKRHLDKAKANDDLIFINGDLLCLMQGKHDPRRSKGDIRPEHNHNDYIDLVINSCADFLRPYVRQIAWIGAGNHETKVSETLGTNILSRLIERLNIFGVSDFGDMYTPVVQGAYTSFQKIIYYNSSTSKYTVNMMHDHGHWGGIITKGTLSAVRYCAFYPDFDICYSGHTHDSWIVPQPTLKIENGRVINKPRWVVRSGTYKEEFTKGSGWAVERIGSPKFLGCIRTEIDITFTGGRVGHIIKPIIEQAV